MCVWTDGQSRPSAVSVSESETRHTHTHEGNRTVNTAVWLLKDRAGDSSRSIRSEWDLWFPCPAVGPCPLDPKILSFHRKHNLNTGGHASFDLISLSHLIFLALSISRFLSISCLIIPSLRFFFSLFLIGQCERCRASGSDWSPCDDNIFLHFLSHFDVLTFQHLGQRFLHPEGREARGGVVGPALGHEFAHLS